MTENTIWSPANPGIPLSLGEVHVWRARLDLESPLLDRCSASLSKEELERAARFKFMRDRDHFSAGRGILRQLLGGYLGEPARDVRLETMKYGKPMLASAAKNSSLQFNVSHSHGLALFAFSREQGLGIDLEKVRPEVALEGIENRFFSSREQAELAALAVDFRPEGFFLCWTRKEAYVKAHGMGLLTNLKAFDVSLMPDEPAELNSSDKDRWSLYSLQPGPGFAGALVVEGKEHRLRFLDLDAHTS